MHIFGYIKLWVLHIFGYQKIQFMHIFLNDIIVKRICRYIKVKKRLITNEKPQYILFCYSAIN